MEENERRLLLVEDCAEVRDLALFCLRNEGWTVRPAATLAQARGFEGDRFDLILTDYELPDGFGTSLVSIFSAPLVLFSAQPPEELGEGVVGLIKKPFDPLALAGQIQSYLAQPD